MLGASAEVTTEGNPAQERVQGDAEPTAGQRLLVEVIARSPESQQAQPQPTKTRQQMAASSGISLETGSRPSLNHFATPLHPEFGARAATQPDSVLDHRVADSNDHESRAATGTPGRVRRVVFGAVSQQLAALRAVKEHSSLVNAGWQSIEAILP